MRTRLSQLVLIVPIVLLSACSAAPAESSAPVTLRLGYFPNVTHATAIVGVRQGILADALGADVTLTTQAFNAGPEAVEALFNGAIDATYIGPSPTINAFTRSGGEAVRIISGATSGGASLVVRQGIESAADLAGARIATPQLGNTQDVALRAWLAEQGYETNVEGGGDVSVLPQSNGDTLNAFIAGELDGAWVPEPWATRLVAEGNGSVLVDEADLWPGGQFVTTQLIVATQFLEDHPDVVKRLLVGHVQATAFVNEQTQQAQEIVGAGIAELTSSELPAGILADAWSKLEFTVDPIASSLTKSADEALALGLIESADLDGIYDLSLLNQVLNEAGQPEVPAP